ncbi:hypothetical protein ACTXT7_014954 [Hymenolepis weldensis]
MTPHPKRGVETPAELLMGGRVGTTNHTVTPRNTANGPPKSGESDPPKSSTGDVSDNKVSLVQRFKNAYKVYGKVLIVVHGVTSVAWLGLFYLIAYSQIKPMATLNFQLGLPLVPFMCIRALLFGPAGLRAYF